MTTIEFKDVSFGYGSGKDVFEHIDLEISGPGLVCIIGPNGVGKSTLVKLINKLNKPRSGEILIDGRNVEDMSQKEIADYVGFVPAGTSDVFSMTVIDTVLIGRHNKTRWKTTHEDLEVVHKALDLLDLEPLAMQGFNELSAGQHQKVALARGLVMETPALILDEPTSNLDVKHQVYVAEMLRAIAIQQQKLIIMICHDLNIAARYSHELIVMAKPGRIYAVGKPEDVVNEKMIRDVYDIDSKVIEFDNSPHVILRSLFDDDQSAQEDRYHTSRSQRTAPPVKKPIPYTVRE